MALLQEPEPQILNSSSKHFQATAPLLIVGSKPVWPCLRFNWMRSRTCCSSKFIKTLLSFPFIHLKIDFFLNSLRRCLRASEPKLKKWNLFLSWSNTNSQYKIDKWSFKDIHWIHYLQAPVWDTSSQTSSSWWYIAEETRWKSNNSPPPVFIGRLPQSLK